MTAGVALAVWLLEFRHEEIAPAHLDSAARMDLQRNHAVGLSDLLIHQIDHLHTVEPCGDVVPHRTKAHRIPLAHAQRTVFFLLRLNQPCAGFPCFPWIPWLCMLQRRNSI